MRGCDGVVVVLGGGGEAGGVMAQSLRFSHSDHPSGQTPRTDESFITTSRLARLTDATAGH